MPSTDAPRPRLEHKAGIDPGGTQNYRSGKEAFVTLKSSILLTDEQHGVNLLRQRMDAEELGSAALRELLSRRRAGAFVKAEQLDGLLARMVAEKRCAQGLV